MAREKFVKRHITEEEKDRLLHRAEELTEAEKDRLKRYKEMIQEKDRRAREGALARGGKEIVDDVYEK